MALPIHVPKFAGSNKNAAILIAHGQYGAGRAATHATPAAGRRNIWRRDIIDALLLYDTENSLKEAERKSPKKWRRSSAHSSFPNSPVLAIFAVPTGLAMRRDFLRCPGRTYREASGTAAPSLGDSVMRFFSFSHEAKNPLPPANKFYRLGTNGSPGGGGLWAPRKMEGIEIW